MVRMAGKLSDDQIIQSNSGSKTIPPRTYLALQEVVGAEGLLQRFFKFIGSKRLLESLALDVLFRGCIMEIWPDSLTGPELDLVITQSI